MIKKKSYRKSTIHQSEPKNKGCGRELPLDKFGINNGYIRSFCKDCNNKYHREYRHSFSSPLIIIPFISFDKANIFSI